jgi:uncharacterized protein with HEPN domain
VTAPLADAAELDAALIALDRIADLVAEGRAAFDDSSDRRLALVFLWVDVGSLLKQFSRKRRIEPGTAPFARPIQMRDKLVYGPLTGLQPAVVWDTCVHDAPPLRTLLTELRATP